MDQTFNQGQSYRHGIYLVGWHFGQHDPQPPRLPALPQLAAQLTRQAAALAPAHVIRACVLDIRLPADSARQQAESLSKLGFPVGLLPLIQRLASKGVA